MILGLDDTSECYLLTNSKYQELISWCRNSATARAKKKEDTCVLEADLHNNEHSNSAIGAMLLGNKLLNGEVAPETNNRSNIVPCKLKPKEEKSYE